LIIPLTETNEIQEKSPLRIFLCHSSEDKPRVRALYQRLSSEGFDPWLDEENLLPGQEWKREIPKAVRASHIVIICLSSNAINKAGYVQKEIKYALDVAEEQPEGTIFLIPLKLEECDVPERLGRWQWVKYYEQNGYKQLMSSLRMRAETITSGVTNIEESKTFTNLKEFVLNEVGRYQDEGPIRHVTIPKSFYMSKYEVTQKQWCEVMGSNPSNFNGDDLPVENVSWDDVQKFIQKINDKEETDKYRLPSEAEWEYAARAGITSRYSFGEDESELANYAWYAKNSGNRTHPVGQKKPNSWGLYDMHGNVWEWVQDEWHDSYDGAPSDGSAWEDGDGTFRVVRGVSWRFDARYHRSAYRTGFDPDNRINALGFRLLQEL
jgi:formylglycine-generating enzyme required for sulfatase activity